MTTTNDVLAYTEGHLHDVAARLLARTSAPAARVTLSGQTSFLTRFANNQIHQNVAEQDLRVTLHVAFDGRVGKATTNDVTDEALARAVADAEALARCAPEDPGFPGFGGRHAIQPIPEAAVARTLGFGPGDRARVVGHACRDAAALGLTASGSFATGLKQLAIADSTGGWAYHAGTLAHFNGVVMGDDSSGWAADTSLDAGQIDGAALAHEAIEKCRRAAHPGELEPGAYTVILEPYAVHELLQQLARGFAADEVREGKTFLSGRVGEAMVAPTVSIWDDPRDLAGVPAPFDHEGVPTTRAALFTQGVAGEPVSDMRSAKDAGRPSTGHHFNGGAFWSAGPVPRNLFLAPGDATPEGMLAATERGIWVTRFHYVNQLDPRATTLTGMTRDGTFWVEDGKIVRPLRNMRFTHAVLAALRDADMIGRDTKLLPNYFGGGNRVPALRIRNFRFTGKTTF